jgi:hypothetical protein
MNNTQQLLDAVGPGAAAELTKEVQLAEIMRLADEYAQTYDTCVATLDHQTRKALESAVRKALGLL